MILVTLWYYADKVGDLLIRFIQILCCMLGTKFSEI